MQQPQNKRADMLDLLSRIANGLQKCVRANVGACLSIELFSGAQLTLSCAWLLIEHSIVSEHFIVEIKGFSIRALQKFY